MMRVLTGHYPTKNKEIARYFTKPVLYNRLILLLHASHPFSEALVGHVENGNQRVFKNLLSYCSAIWYKDKG